MDKERLMLIVGIVAVVVIAFFGWCYTKKSPAVEKWGWRGIGLLVAAFVVFTLWYHVPIICRDNVQVVETRAQKEAVIELELMIQRSYLHGTKISGWICTPVDTYGASWVGEATRKNGGYHCSTMFRADTMAWEPSFDHSVDIFYVAFSRNFREITYLDLMERRETGEVDYWYQTPAKP